MILVHGTTYCLIRADLLRGLGVYHRIIRLDIQAILFISIL